MEKSSYFSFFVSFKSNARVFWKIKIVSHQQKNRGKFVKQKSKEEAATKEKKNKTENKPNCVLQKFQSENKRRRTATTKQKLLQITTLNVGLVAATEQENLAAVVSINIH